LTEYVDQFPTGNGLGGSPIAGALVSVCPTSQCPCSGSDAPTQQADDAGFVTFSAVAAGEKYCLQASAQGFLTTLAFGGPPYTEDVVSVGDTLLEPQALGIALVPSNYDRMGVNVGVKVFDCLSDPAQNVNVSISVSPSSAAGGDDSGVGSEAGPWQADANANGSPSFGPAPPGVANLTATVPGVGVVSQVTALVAPGMVTEVGMFPNSTR
jgi:hypothetical protein